MSFRSVFFMFLGLVSSVSVSHAATITINVLDGVGIGFNDTTAAAPVGGNDGTTVGEQRLKAFEHVAGNIGAYLESSVPIVIDARFAGLQCNANSGVLGSAGSNFVFRDFANAPLSNTFYSGALANALANADIDPSNNDISASFNGDLGKTGCLENSSWYYGFDHNEPNNGIDFIATLTHELIHGLGFTSFANETNGRFLGVSNSTAAGIFDKFIFDIEQKKTWADMTDAERVAAAINDPNLAWSGDNVTAAASYLTSGTRDIDIVTVNSGPTTLKGEFVRLFAPNPVQSGSSVSHFTDAATPNLLMEPIINSDLFSSKIDLSQQLLKDIGWPFQASSLSDISVTLASSATQVPLGSNFSYVATVSNNDQADADLIKTKLILPTGVSYQSASGSGWTCVASTNAPVIVNCDLNTVIANSASSVLTIAVTAPSTGTGSFTSEATAATITVESNPNNNKASQSVEFIGNNLPVASDASFSTTEGVVVSGTLLASDTDNGNNLTFSIVSNGTKGSATLNNTATGAFTYTPTAGQTGQDSFTFKVNDGLADSNTATVTIKINAAPIANNGSLVVTAGQSISGTLSAMDANGDTLTFSIVSNGSNGTAAISNPTTGAFTYTANANASGQDSFTFKVNDGSLDSNTATINVTFNAIPVASNASFSTLEATAISNRLSASDADNGDTLTFSLVSNGSKGTAVITDSATGGFTYTPTTGKSGQDSFSFKVNDGAIDSNTATITININATPVTSNITISTMIGAAVSGTLTASDADNDASLTFSIVSNATQGAAVITNAATGAFTYTPNNTVTNTTEDSFTFKVNDGLIDSNTATANVTIKSVQTTTSKAGGDIAVSTGESGANVAELEVLDDNDALIDSPIATQTMPVDTTFPHGFIAYKINGVPTGATVSIDIVFPSIPDNPKLYKIDANNGFVEFTAFSVNTVTNTVTITLVDGGAGDADGIANGVIDDPLGLAAAPAEVASNGNSISSGGGGGGSFDFWLLATLLMSYGLRRYLKNYSRK